jgi:hypothetical protein
VYPSARVFLSSAHIQPNAFCFSSNSVDDIFTTAWVFFYPAVKSRTELNDIKFVIIINLSFLWELFYRLVCVWDTKCTLTWSIWK